LNTNPGRVLVTGASGFVGGALVRTLASRGVEVCAAVRARPVASLPPAIRILSGFDLAVGTDWSAALQDGVHSVVHCAARVHQLDDRSSDPLQAFREVNRDGTLALARQAAAAGVRRFVFVSTIGVNGASTRDRPFRADSVPSPHSPYAVSKWEAEQALNKLSAETGMTVAIVRPPMVIGANAPGNVERLMRWLDRGVPLPLAGVHNRRSFVAVNSLVDLLCRLLAHPRAAGTWLVSDGEDLSTPELLQRVGAALGRPARLLPFPAALLWGALYAASKGEVATSLLSSLQVDSRQTRTDLDWMPPVSTDDAIRDAAREYRVRHPLA
jgi:nucleoside-diphosphate-sugar epimerase